ncbi:MAG: phosphoheptose isomerase [Bacteroidetes bacterium]|nr:MAG: phosphoheptose isomerase [Bacteroidota bacterium]
MPKARSHFREALSLLSNLIEDEQFIDSVDIASDALSSSLRSGGKILCCGNGGSMSDAMHFAEELSGKFRDDRPAYAAIAISSPAHITCVANDYGFDKVFSRGVEALGKPGDALLVISTSGNSPNIVEAARVAKANGIKVVALTGKDGGTLVREKLLDYEIRIPWNGYSDRIQEMHIKCIHAMIDYIEKSLAS